MLRDFLWCLRQSPNEVGRCNSGCSSSGICWTIIAKLTPEISCQVIENAEDNSLVSFILTQLRFALNTNTLQVLIHVLHFVIPKLNIDRGLGQFPKGQHLLALWSECLFGASYEVESQ